VQYRLKNQENLHISDRLYCVVAYTIPVAIDIEHVNDYTT